MRQLLIMFVLLAGVVAQNVMLVVGQVSLTLLPVADNYADSKYPGSAYGHTSFLYVGNAYDRAQDIWGSERIYIRFDLDQIPKGRTILQATLRLWQYYAPSSEQHYETHRVLEDWDEFKENWNNQPTWAEAKTSETVAPAQSEVAVEWDITSDAKAWYSGEADNYGTMIKVAVEEHAQDASSGFWSKEYPEDEWKPRLVLAIQGNPALTYSVKLTVSGLPTNVTSEITIDEQQYSSISPAMGAELLLDKGTIHTIEVSELVSGSAGARYRCERNQIRVANETVHEFAYGAEYLITFSKESDGSFQTPSDGWYKAGAVLMMNRTGPDLIDVAPGVHLVFDGWYADSQKIKAPEFGHGTVKTTAVPVNGTAIVEGRYETEYYLNVTSPYGRTGGSGWYRKDSVASFSIDTDRIPAEGLLGLLGLRHSFTGWTGSSSFIGIPVEADGSVAMKEPTTVEATWKDDWNAMLVTVAVLVGAVMLVAAILIMLRKRTSPALHGLRQTVSSLN